MCVYIYIYIYIIYIYLYKCFDGVPRGVRVDQGVRLEAASCPLDPLIFVDTPAPYGHFYLTIVCPKSSKWPYGVRVVHSLEKSSHMVWER